MKYRKKPVVVEAYQTEKEIIIHTLEGDMKANVGDYIITGVNGEQYPCKPDIFEKTYELVKENEPPSADDSLNNKDIIKALKICTSSSNGCSHNSYTCDDCYLKGQPMCSAVLHQDTIDFINRLETENKELHDAFYNKDRIKVVQTKAIKEFAERLKINYSKPLFAVGSYNEFIREVDNLVKEMVGEE